MASLALPIRASKRLSAAAQAAYDDELAAWYEAARNLETSVQIRVLSRGWCYILEEHGLLKGDFDKAQKLINAGRKTGALPLDICVEDERRVANGVEEIDDSGVEDYRHGHVAYTPTSFWEEQDHYVELAVVKIDLKSLFAPVCEPFRIAIRNIGGWSDINSRAAMMRRCADWEAKGKQCVLLYCGDHDPSGLQVSGWLRSNLADLKDARLAAREPHHRAVRPQRRFHRSQRAHLDRQFGNIAWSLPARRSAPCRLP